MHSWVLGGNYLNKHKQIMWAKNEVKPRNSTLLPKSLTSVSFIPGRRGKIRGRKEVKRRERRGETRGRETRGKSRK